METAPLKSFATWARTALIREVIARIAVVLAPASADRVEQPKVVGVLERAVTAAGGGDNGKAAVADRVAYTWFNRIIALRFMDANGYTGIGVVSPQAGVETGQPEILAEAKRGNIDAAVVGTKTRETVTGLLNGTRRSADAQGEAYALLLADYCRYWNRAMPFMFEREADFTELLIPANLLADDSVPNYAVKVLTAEVCQDVEVIGWLYQFYISERKDEVFAGFKKNKKAGADEIPAATQLFTPHWIVRYLVENSLGRLWILNRPSSRLANQMEYYIAPAEEEMDFFKISSPEELKVVDPACGSGHMLTYAFDLLYAIYEEEGYAPAEIPGLILANNLYGVEIDPRAGALAALALTMKARAKHRTFFNKQVEPKVGVLDPIRFTPDEIDFLLTRGGDRHAESAFWNQFEHSDTLGSLIQPDPDLTARLKRHLAKLDGDGDILLADVLNRAERVLLQAEVLSATYHVVVANPPYMGVKNMSSALAGFIETYTPNGKQDLYGAFVERARRLASKSGLIAMITGDTWMFIKTFTDLRNVVLREAELYSLLYLRDSTYHADKFGANSAFVFSNAHNRDVVGVFVQLSGLDGEDKRNALLAAINDKAVEYRHDVAANQFTEIPGSPFAFAISDQMRSVFSRAVRLDSVAEPRQGMATSDNGRFLRFAHEVSRSRISFNSATRYDAIRSGAKWYPYRKGGERRRWYGNNEYVVNWENDGAELFAFRPRAVIRNPSTYFKEALTWSLTSANGFAARYCPPGYLYDVNGMSSFAESGLLEVLGTVNSTVGAELLAAMNPTLAFQVGDISAFPYIAPKDPGQFTSLVEECIAIAREDWDSQETSWDFSSLPALRRKKPDSTLTDAMRLTYDYWANQAERLRQLEWRINTDCEETYGLSGDVRTSVDLSDLTVTNNPHVTDRSLASLQQQHQNDVARLVSFSVGCMFGRYSLDEPGLILADQGATLADYLAKVPSPTFPPDKDNVIPIVEGEWFEDDIVARFRTFLRAAFGEEHFEENLRFVMESLGVKDVRDYFVKSFYKDHVQQYKKRPIYWLFSSPRGSFNALIYMHRYTPSTVSTVLNEYLREFRAKLASSLQQWERQVAGGGTPRQQAAAQKEADRLRKVLLELEEYEHDVLYPLASRQLAIDLDDGVKANYPKFGAALKKIVGLEASDE
jgi:hypothetical protein